MLVSTSARTDRSSAPFEHDPDRRGATAPPSEARRATVIHVLWSGGVGGIERLVHDLARAQSDAGRSVGVAFARDEGAFSSSIRAAGIPVASLDIRSGYDLDPRRLRRAARELSGWDIVHMHGFNLPLALVAARSRRPLVFTDHGSVPAGRRRLLAARVKRRLLGLFATRYRVLVTANSRYTATRAVSECRLDPHRVQIVYNGIVQDPRNHAQERRDAGLVVAFVGRLVRFKRVERLIEAVARIDRAAEVRAIVVGTGPLEKELRALSARLRLNDRVTFLGARDDVPEILLGVDVLVQPSTAEPFGLAIVEGCSAGALPIVFDDAGGALEVLPPDGVVVRDVDELAAALSRLARGSDALAAEARRARAAFAGERFSISRTRDSFDAVYAQVEA